MAPDAFPGPCHFGRLHRFFVWNTRPPPPQHLQTAHASCPVHPSCYDLTASQRSAAPIVWSARGAPSFFPPPKVRGSGAPEGAPCNEPRWWAWLAPLAIGALASRRSTGGVLLSAPGRAFAGYTGRQRAPRGRLIVASRADPRRRPSACLRGTSAGAAPTETGISPASAAGRVRTASPIRRLRPAPPPDALEASPQ